MCSSFPDFLNDLIMKGKLNYPRSESDIISDYIDGKIDKEEYIRRMNSYRNSSKENLA